MRKKIWFTAAVLVTLSASLAMLAGARIVRTNTDTSTSQATMVLGGRGQWSHMTQMDIFAALEDEGDGKLIAPGCEGSYPFTIANTYTEPVSFVLDIADENTVQIPIQFRLRMDGEYMAGNDDHWVSMSEIKLVSGGIPGKSEKEFELDWKWDGTNDAADTESGILAQGNNASYVLNISVTTERWGVK